MLFSGSHLSRLEFRVSFRCWLHHLWCFSGSSRYRFRWQRNVGRWPRNTWWAFHCSSYEPWSTKEWARATWWGLLQSILWKYLGRRSLIIWHFGYGSLLFQSAPWVSSRRTLSWKVVAVPTCSKSFQCSCKWCRECLILLAHFYIWGAARPDLGLESLAIQGYQEWTRFFHTCPPVIPAIK